MLGNFFPVMAAMDAPAKDDGQTRTSNGLYEFPGEQPTDKEISDWLDDTLPLLRQQFGALMRGETPARLQHLRHGADDLTGFTPVSTTTLPAGMNLGQAMAHNRKVQEAVAAKASRAEQLKMGLREDKDQLSQVLVRALRPGACRQQHQVCLQGHHLSQHHRDRNGERRVHSAQQVHGPHSVPPPFGRETVPDRLPDTA
jgi:hypothetical protein